MEITNVTPNAVRTKLNSSMASTFSSKLQEGIAKEFYWGKSNRE